MSDLRKAAQQALEALEMEATSPPIPETAAAITALRAALKHVEQEPSSTWSEDLVCNWISWSVVKDGHLRLDMPELNCCDMKGAIKMAETLCPEVSCIDTFQAGKPDTSYLFVGGKWKSFE